MGVVCRAWRATATALRSDGRTFRRRVGLLHLLLHELNGRRRAAPAAQVEAALLVVPELHRLPAGHRPAGELAGPGQDVEEGTLARAVGADHDDAVAALERVREAVCEGWVVRYGGGDR